MTTFRLNGEEVKVGDHEHLLAALREELGVTLAQGRLLAVGAVRVLHGARRRQGGRQLPACRWQKVEGKAVTTLEGLPTRPSATASPTRSPRAAGCSAGSASRASSCGPRR